MAEPLEDMTEEEKQWVEGECKRIWGEEYWKLFPFGGWLFTFNCMILARRNGNEYWPIAMAGGR